MPSRGPQREREGISARAYEAALDYLDSGEGSDLRRLAECLVDLRETYIGTDGRIDWAGRSWHYRHEVALLWQRLGDSDEVESLKAAVRYHVGNVIRERASDEDLAAAGLKTATPRDRAAGVRAQHAALLKAAGAATLDGPMDPLTSVEAALALVSRISSGDVKERKGVSRKRIREAVALLQAEVTRLSNIH
jgi:hypothetical protein